MFTTLNSKLKRMLSVVLALSMVLSPIMALAEEVGGAVATALEEPVAVVFAASDFQPRKMTTNSDGSFSYDNTDRDLQLGMNNFLAIAENVKRDYDTVTGAFFCGDYSNESKYRNDYAYSNTAAPIQDGINIVEGVFGGVFGLSREETVLIQGNHDIYRTPLKATGAHDREQYGVYAINEKDFMYKQATLANGEDTVKKTASDLERYLQAKVAQHYNKPIFILNHIPLHHNPRAEDNRYAEHIFNVINRAGEQGLTIFYLFGHNHSKGYDAHIGEAAIYLEPGEVMYIPDSKTFEVGDGSCAPQKKVLNFAYLNAGYVGYVTKDNEGCADNALTATVFAIYEDRVEIKRYDGTSDGEHLLKAPGKAISDFEGHDLHIYNQSTESDVLRLDDKFNVSLNIEELYPLLQTTSKYIDGRKLTFKGDTSDPSTLEGTQVNDSAAKFDKTFDIRLAENFIAGTEGKISIDCAAVDYEIKSVSSSAPGIATAEINEDGEITVRGVAPGQTTLTVVTTSVSGKYNDITLTYDLVVFPPKAETKSLSYSRYRLLGNSYSSTTFTTNANGSLTPGQTYVFVDTHKVKTKDSNEEKNWPYALLNSPSGSSTLTSRNVTVYGSSTVYVDEGDEYMEWVYCDGGYFRNAATGLFLTSNVKTTNGTFSLVNVCPRDANGENDYNDDFNEWTLGANGLYIDDNTSTTNTNYQRYMQFNFATKRFLTETNTNDAAKQKSNISIYEKVKLGNANADYNGGVAWLDTTTISAFEDDLDGATSANIYIANVMGVTTVPVTLNMLTSPTERITNDTGEGLVSNDFKLVYDGVTLADNISLTIRTKPTWTKTDANQETTVGGSVKIDSLASIPDAEVSYSYESLNLSCATVSDDGTVTGVGVGGALIRVTATATYSDNSTVSTKDDVYVTVRPGNSCSTLVRKFGSNEVYQLINTGALKSHDYGEVVETAADAFIVVNTNHSGEAFAMQNYAGTFNNLRATDVIVESYNGQRFIQTEDPSITWRMVQKESFAKNSTAITGGTPANNTNGKYLPQSNYYQMESLTDMDDGFQFLTALQDLRNNELHGSNEDLSLDSETNLFCTIGKSSYVWNDTYKDGKITDRNGAVAKAFNADDNGLINGKATSFKDPACAWSYEQPNVGLCAINYNPLYTIGKNCEGKEYFNAQDNLATDYAKRMTYVMTYNEELRAFQAKYHPGVWPSGLKDQYTDLGVNYPGRVYLYAKRNIQTSGVMIWISDKNEGTVGYNALNGTATGAMINVTTHSPEGVSTVSYPLTYGMLSKEGGLSTAADAKYENVTVKYTYNGVEYEVCTQFTLNVKNMAEDYPDYPDQGSVNTNKTLDTSKYNYKGKGVSHIDLTVSGIPLTSGIDIVVMIDASTSMQDAVGGNTKTRLQMLYESLSAFMISLRQPDENGKISDVDVAIASFNGQTYLNKDHLISPLVPTCNCGTNHGTKYTYYNAPDMSTVNLPFADVTDPEYAAFIDSLNYDIENSEFEKNVCNVKTIVPSSGTNYDRAMDLTYDLLTAKQAQNTARGENREQYVIFMTDGETWQYNYFGGRNYNEKTFLENNPSHKKYVYHNSNNVSKWMYVLDGRLDTDDEMFADNADLAATQWNTDTVDKTPVVEEAYQALFKKYYNPEGKHWMAEAIKGDPAKKYMIIDPDSTKPDHIEQVYGLGATMYTIAFTIGDEPTRGIEREVTEGVVRRMATSAAHYTSVETDQNAAKNLLDAFMKIKNETKSSGSAMYVDQMGDDFDLQMRKEYVVNEKEYVLDPAPTITLTSYPLYKYWEVGTVVDGVKVSQDMVGKRKSNTGTEIEKIWFNDDGSLAFSSLIVNDDNTNPNILIGGIGGVIKGKNVWYNTGSSAYTVTADDVALAPSLTEGQTLEPETFYWMIGDVPEDEYVLGYDVYLEGSMEATALAGQHDTNNYATLTYINHLKHKCYKDVPSPKLPWDEAYVGVGFYFVNEQGQPLVNRTTGKTGSFEASQKLIDIQYYNFKLNETGVVDREIIAKAVLPAGYTLYDESAEYTVFAASSNEYDQNWTIVKGDVPVASTYVTQFGSSATSSNKLKETSKDLTYTNTIVYFAIVGSVNAVPDTVVIDYALPVDIDVMSNDILFAGDATLEAVGFNENSGSVNDDEKDRATLLDGFKADDNSALKEKEYTFGTANVLDTSSIRYNFNTENSMEFNEKDVITYAAYYSGDLGVNGYYYADVYVIPATTVYYEENFATYEVFDLKEGKYLEDPYTDPAGDNGRYNSWQKDEEGIKSGSQAQDRPGKLTSNDVNNIYGFDGAYADSYAYANGSAYYFKTKADPSMTASNGKKAGRYEGEITFTFYGTGFDLISLSSARTGSVLVKVYDISDGDLVIGTNYLPTEKPVVTKFVDTYYGYSYNAETGEWEVNTDSSTVKDDLYQIPVIKVNCPKYGKYKVYLTMSYSEGVYAHRDEYSFYMDSVRIYDPANNGATDEVIGDAYVRDNEGWPVYQELRNLLISVESFNSLGHNSVSGSIFIDGKPDENGMVDGQFDITNYSNYGPNNEVYLMKGQAIAFDLNNKENAAAVHIAMKAVGKYFASDDEDASDVGVSVRMYNAVENADGTVAIKNKIEIDNIRTSSDLYYDISKLNGGTIVIVNESTARDDPTRPAILSITNLKFTYESEEKKNADSAQPPATVSQQTRNVTVAAMRKLAMPWLDVEVETSGAFVPEKFDVSLSKTNVRQGSTVTVVVNTSADVDHITINGVEVTRYTKSWFTSERQWKYTVRATEAGDMPIEVVAYNSDGDASDAVENTVTVTKRLSLGSNSSGGLFDRIYGGWFGSIFAKAN